MTPSAFSRPFTQPVSGLSIPCQMNTVAMNGTTYGRNSNTRNTPDATRWRECRSSATRNGRMTATGSASSMYLNVIPSDAQACLSLRSVS